MSAIAAYASNEIEGLDGSSIFVEEVPENPDLPLQLKRCTVVIKRDGKPASTIRLGFSAANELRIALYECFTWAPGAVIK